MRKVLIIVAIAISFCLGFIYSNAMTILPKDVSTANRLKILERAVKRYYDERHKLPSGLMELVGDGYTERDICKDRWGNEIEYSIVDSNMVRLVSIGDPSLRRSLGLEYRISNTFQVRGRQQGDGTTCPSANRLKPNVL